MYSERLLDHFRNPRCLGELGLPAVTVEASNPVCGDVLRISARFDGGVVVEARYRSRGCTASIAVGSAVTEWMTGKTRADLAALDAATIEGLVDGLPAESKHAGALALDAVRAVVRR